MSDAIKINLGVSVAIANTARLFGAEQTGVKWPNDVWVGERKLSGVLTNSDVTRDGKLVLMVGIGVNLNENMSSNLDANIAGHAISMNDIVQSEIDREVGFVPHEFLIRSNNVPGFFSRNVF
jgi:BirA family transcriptional regulator, biotin operon repressor / biotin---[acetyl-CoA-carboxylase] ligase